MPKHCLSIPTKLSLILLAIFAAFSIQAANLSLERRISEALDNPSLSGKAVWLVANEGRFLAIYEPSSAKLSLGGALILHDAGTHADWIEVIQPLRQHLSEQGWNTLSLQLPATESRPDPRTTQSLLEKASPRIQAAIDYLDPQQQPTLVLVGHGLGATMALHHAAKQPNQRIKAIAAIGLSIDTEDESTPAAQAIAQLQIPLLDLFGSRDLTAVRESAAKRRQIASMNGREDYRQEKVNGANHFFTGLQSSLSHRIHAWLKRSTSDATGER
ncbi:MAG: alpha/beta fold hydrolase [Candidatus Thiodiazotropha sp. 6PLUC9]